MKMASPKPWAAFFAFALVWGCSPKNDNDVGCVAKDCEASCSAAGLTGGTCRGGDRCVCDQSAPGPYPWLAPVADAGPDASTSADTGTSGSADTLADSDTSSGTVPPTDSQADTNTDTGTPVAADTGTAPQGDGG